jgi:hypothetical protein
MAKANEYGRWDIVSELANARGWTMGAELGVLSGLLYFRLLARCPGLTLVGVDIWEHQPEQDAIYSEGGRSYLRHDLAACECKVRDAARQYGKRAILHKMRTVDAAGLYEDGTFDFVFLDADHTYAGVKGDIAAWLPKIKRGGAIMGHDYQPAFPGVMRAVDEAFGGRARFFKDSVWKVECSK